MNPSNEPKQCPICKSPLGQFELEHNHKFHEACGTCIYCHEPVQQTIVLKLINEYENELDSGSLTGARIYHRPCQDKFMAEELKKRPVQVTQEMVDYWNEQNLMFAENMDISPMNNQQEAANLSNAFHTKWFKDKTLEEQYVHLKRMEAATIAFSLLVDKANRKEVKKAVEAHEVKRIARQDKEQKEKIKAENQARVERLDPVERNKAKAIKAAMSLGLSEEQAKQWIESQGGAKQ